MVKKSWGPGGALGRSVMFAAFAAVAVSGTAFASESFPERPITVIVGSSAGGGGDIFARALSDQMGQHLGQPVVVENRPGASGNIGAEYVASGETSGHTILFTFTGHVINPALFRELPFDPVEDFKPIIMLATNTTVVVVPAASNVETFAELVEEARSRPGELNTGTLLGSSQHLAAAAFASAADVEFEIIPYQGNAGALQDLLGARLDFMFNTLQASRFESPGHDRPGARRQPARHTHDI